MDRKDQRRLRRALRFSWWFGGIMLVFQLLEHTALDSQVEPYLVDPSAAVHAMAVFVVAGAVGGFLLGWFWDWRGSALGSAALGILAMSAFTGGFSVLLREPGDRVSLEDLVSLALIMGLLGGALGWLMYHEKKSGLATRILNTLDSWW